MADGYSIICGKDYLLYWIVFAPLLTASQPIEYKCVCPLAFYSFPQKGRTIPKSSGDPQALHVQERLCRICYGNNNYTDMCWAAQNMEGQVEFSLKTVLRRNHQKLKALQLPTATPLSSKTPCNEDGNMSAAGSRENSCGTKIRCSRGNNLGVRCTTVPKGRTKTSFS